jgi:hypothetical protein
VFCIILTTNSDYFPVKREQEWGIMTGIKVTVIITEGNREFTDLNIPRQCPLVLLVKVGCKQTIPAPKLLLEYAAEERSSIFWFQFMFRGQNPVLIQH